MINMKTGRIIKNVSNQYTIDTGTETIVALPRGNMRKGHIPVVGDLVEFESFGKTNRIHRILPRKNRLLRPAVANVDQALIVTSLYDPDFSDHLLNRLIFLVCLEDVEPVLCITKCDLSKNKEYEKKLAPYEKAGYTIVYSYPGSNDDALKKLLAGKISVLCGQSGAGKSSLLNRLDPHFQLQTQAISKALGRGKHTTRHCALYPIANGWVVDTPGFSSLDLQLINTDDLDKKIKDFVPYIGHCRFKDCKHLKEPDCAVKLAVETGEINPTIYEDYRQIKEELWKIR